MKLTGILMLAAVLQVSAGITAQTVSYTARSATLQQVFAAIKQQTGYFFFYKAADLETIKPVSVELRDLPLKDALTILLKDQPLSFSIEGNTVFVKIRPVNSLPALTAPDFLPVTGVVRDAEGAPVSGANVTVKGSTTGTVTDGSGAFGITAATGAVLIISSAGYETREVKVTGEAIVIVLIRKVTEMMDVTVNKGYYSTSQRLNTGSVSKISSAVIDKEPVTNLLQALQGRVAGLLITSTSGVPGSDMSVQIRGINSVGAGSAPLYIIDGVIIPSSSISSINADNGVINPLNTINPADVASVEVLKDADATAIYGSRGANGVILITTKKATPGKTKFDLDIYKGAGRPSNTIGFLDTRQYIQLRRKAFAADGITPDANNAPDLLTWDTTAYNNWQKLLLGKAASVTNIQATVSGGDERTHFLLGAGFRDEGTILLGDGSDKRMNAHLNVEHASLNKRFHIQTNLIYGKDLIHTLSNDPYSGLVTPPNMPLFDSTGNPYWLGGSIGLYNMISYQYTKAKTTTDQFIGNTDLRYTLPANLELKVSVGYTNMQQNQFVTHPDKSLNPNFNAGYSNYTLFGASYSNSVILEPQLNYGGKIGNGKLQALIGSSLQSNNTGSTYLFATDFASDALMESLGAATNILTKSSSTSQYHYESVFGRVNYNYKEKYIINGVLRRDGSSRFGPGKRFADFWSLGAAWLFYEEKNMNNLFPWLSFGKLRGSYGITGNDQIGNYQYLQTYASSSPYLGVPGLYPNKLANEDYSWESNKKTEAALELGLFHNRISLSVAWFHNRSGNQLVNYPLASQTGFMSYQANLPALVQNQGWEFELQTTNIRSTAFTWTTNFNLTVARNKLLRFPGLAASSYADRLEIGQPLNLLKLYHFTGIDPQTGVPLVEDVDKDGQVGFGKDRINAGTRDPKFYGGMGNHLAYKNFSLDIFFQFQKATGYGYLYSFSQPPGFITNVPKEFTEGTWTKPGDKATRPGLTSTAASETYFAYSNYYTQSDAALSDASYIRLKTLSLSYSIPSRLMDKWKISGFRIFVQGQNLLTFTSYDGLDPETQTTSPVLKILTAGIHLTL